MSAGYGVRGPEFYADMDPVEFAAHQARDNGDLSKAMIKFDKEIEAIMAMSPADKAKVAQAKWEVLANG